MIAFASGENRHHEAKAQGGGCMMPGEGASGSSVTLYVGNLPWSVDDSQLKQVFSAHADVLAARVITDRETGRSRGYGFVEVAIQNVQPVIESMNGMVLGGRELTVNEAKNVRQ